MNSSYSTVNFMVIDDDEVCIMSIERSLKELKIANPLYVAKDGIEGLEVLRGTLDDSETLPPFIITLDLNMPRMGGLEFLEEVRNDPVFRKLIIFVLTSSDAPSDIASAYEKNIAGYIVKENTTASLHKALNLLNGYANLVVLPV